ncbi:MAG: response regulator [Deltaproteobacteria bacterium]|nr:response regulator [Deltaproteobacteria bacterium]
MNILFIYSNLNEIKNIEPQLNLAGFKIYTSKNLNEATDVLSRVKIDLIICELVSNKIDGIQILRKMKTSKEYSDIPFVIATATMNDEEGRSFFKKLGATAIIEKPISYKTIQNIVDNNITSQELAFDQKQRILSDEEFIEEYSNTLIKRIQKRIKELELYQLVVQNLINSIPSPIFLISQDFKIIDLNDAGMKYIGITDKEEVKNRLCYNLIYKSGRVCSFEGHHCPMVSVIQEKISAEHFLILDIRGTKKHLNINFAPVLNPRDNSILMLEQIFDNTTTTEIINKGKEDGFKLETILNEAKCGIILIENNQIININNTAKSLLGLKDEDINSLIKTIDKSTYEEITKQINQNIVFRQEITIPVENYKKVLLFEAQKVKYATKEFILIMIYDFTENYKLVQALKDNDLLYKTILNNIQDIFILLRQNTIVDISRQIESIIGKSREVCLKQNIFTTIPFIKEKDLIDINQKEVSAKISDGTERIFILKVLNLFMKGEKYTLLQLTDITNTKEIDEIKRVQREKIEYIERLDIAAKVNKGIIQNVNNFLAGINNFAEYITKPDISPETVKVTANTIKRLTKSAASALSKISGLLQRTQDELIPIDINQILDELIDIIKFSLPRNIDIKIDRSSSHNIIKGDYNRLLQALLNIVINSAEAMPDGGTLSISTSSLPQTNDILSSKGKILIKISDTGIGIPEDMKNNIFKPYCSTKNMDGTGLGLSVTYNTIMNHNGSITFDSTIGKGTTFNIVLPVSDIQPIKIKSELTGNKEKILIISENSIEREIIKRVLIRNNYDAYTAIDSLDAIESIKVSRPELIIMDYNLSRLSAYETLRRVSTILPDIDIVLYTGFVLDEAIFDLVLKGIKTILYKPLDIDELLTLVHTTIKKPGINKEDNHQEVSKRKLLIIDDEEFILSALKINLSEKYEIHIETSVAKAIQRLTNGELFDAYIVDINLPGSNGIEFYRTLKEVDQDTKKRVIFITGGILDDKLTYELNLIKDEVSLLEKPFDIESLIKLLP